MVVRAREVSKLQRRRVPSRPSMVESLKPSPGPEKIELQAPRFMVVSRTRHATYEQIVQNSLEVTEARMVVFTMFDPVRGLARTDAWAAQPRATVQRALESVRGVFPGWDPARVEHVADVNPLLRRVYLQGELVTAPIGELLKGVVDPLVSQAGSTFLGIGDGLICPLRSAEGVLGSLTFFFSEAVTARQNQICEGFAHEAALTLENGRLVDEVQQQMERLQAVRSRVREAEERQRQEIAELLHSRVQSSLLLLWRKIGGARELIDRDPEAARAQLEDAQTELDRIREQEIRQASYLLHPSIIRVGLVPALRSLSTQLERWVTVSLTIDPSVSAADNPIANALPDEFRLAAFRIVEAALDRIRRVDPESRVDVGLRLAPKGRFLLTLCHEGAAFLAGPHEDEFALTTISDRIEQLGGTWKGEALPDGRSQLSVSLAINRPASP
jgi:signal transduction histidine kinase